MTRLPSSPPARPSWSRPISWFYGDARPYFRTGHAVGFDSPGLIPRLIKWKTRGSLSHIALVVRIQEYCEDRVFLIEALAGGLTFTALSDRLRETEAAGGKVYWLEPPRAMSGAAQRAIGGYALRQLGARVRYDYRSLIGNIFRHQIADDRLQTCSEFVWRAWGQAWDLPNHGGLAPTPADIMRWWPGVGKTRIIKGSWRGA